MKFVVIKENLKNGIWSIEKSASTNNHKLPILKNVLLEAEDNKVKLTATNLETAANSFVSGKIIEKGKTTIPISIFSELINNIPSDRMSIESRGNSLEIKTDNYQASLQSSPAAEFPLIPKITNTADYIEIPLEILKNSLEKVVLSAQFSDIRPELSSVLFKYSINDLKIVATDSFRLAEKTLPANQFKSTYKNPFSALVPLKTAQEVLRIFKEETITVYIEPNQALFKNSQTELISRLAEGNFPEYEQLVPKKFESEIVADRQEFINSVKLSGIFSSKISEVKIKPTENKKALEISSAGQGIGENKYLLAAKIKNEFEEINFNWRYLMDGLKSVSSKDVFVGINDAGKPALLKSPLDSSYFYILMPIVSSTR